MNSESPISATVVFADLVGSTRFFETNGNTKATRSVTRLTGWIGDLFVAYGGRVVKTLGDGVLAVFPNDAGAIDAVVAMQRSHQEHMRSVVKAMRMPIRVGIATGQIEMVAGDCFGVAVNVAARLCDLCGPHQIWVTSSTLRSLEEPDGVNFRPLGDINIRGLSEACAASQVDWRTDVNSGFLTMQATLEPIQPEVQARALERQVELSWLGSVKTFRTADLPIYIGRFQTCEFVVQDPKVSRRHVRIEQHHGSVMLVDVSSYGSWVRFSDSASELALRRSDCALEGSGEIAMGAPFADESVPTVRFRVV